MGTKANAASYQLIMYALSAFPARYLFMLVGGIQKPAFKL
jgi:hypothetical protein